MSEGEDPDEETLIRELKSSSPPSSSSRPVMSTSDAFTKSKVSTLIASNQDSTSNLQPTKLVVKESSNQNTSSAKKKEKKKRSHFSVCYGLKKKSIDFSSARQ